MIARLRLGRNWPLLVFAGLWLAVIVVVDPRGEFPLNDDWAYAWSVKTLLQEGRFQLSDWGAVNLLPQTLWGWLFSVPGGFSFTALRVSTLIASLITLFALAGFSWDDFTCLSPTPSRPYTAAYQALEGHVIVSSRSYRRWIPPMIDTVFLLRKPAADASQATLTNRPFLPTCRGRFDDACGCGDRSPEENESAADDEGPVAGPLRALH